MPSWLEDRVARLKAARERWGVRCGDCGAPMEPGLTRDKGYLYWRCTKFPACRGRLAAHPDGEPVGHAADAETRRMRMHAHQVFDAAWQGRGMTKDEAYAWLAQIMRKPATCAHIGMFSANECRLLIRRLNGHAPLPEPR